MLKKILHRYCCVLVVFTMLAHFIGVNFFNHTHIQNGVKISHSHPYYPGSNTSHTHSILEFQTIAHLSSLNFFLASFCFSFAIFLHTNSCYVSERLTFLRNNIFADKRHRAPPVL